MLTIVLTDGKPANNLSPTNRSEENHTNEYVDVEARISEANSRGSIDFSLGNSQLLPDGRLCNRI